jgi:hypothetical protein
MQSSAHKTVTSLPRSLRPFRSSILINPHSLLLELGGLARRLGPSRDMAVEMRSYRQGPHVTGRPFVGRLRCGRAEEQIPVQSLHRGDMFGEVYHHIGQHLAALGDKLRSERYARTPCKC